MTTPFPAKVAIVISCDNNIDSIERAVNSVVMQDYPNKQIIIVDDASTDDSWAKICEFIGRKEDIDEFSSRGIINAIPIEAIRHEFKTGMAGVMIAGANLVWKNMDVIGILNGSDEYFQGKISKSIDAIADIMEKVGIVYSDYDTYIGKSSVTIYRESFTRTNIQFGDSVLVTKTALGAVGMVNPDDALHDLWLRITERFVAIHVPEVLTRETRFHAETRT